MPPDFFSQSQKTSPTLGSRHDAESINYVFFFPLLLFCSPSPHFYFLSFLFPELIILSGVLGALALAFLLTLIVFVGYYLYQRLRRGTPDKEGSLQFDCLLLTYGFLPI